MRVSERDEAAGRSAADIRSGALDPTGENLKARAEAELKAWGHSIGGSRFEPAEPPAADHD